MKRKRNKALWLCDDCGVDTYEIDEYYMVNNSLWLEVSADLSGMLCIGCLETRLGRQLTGDDFTDCPLNRSNRYGSRASVRLQSRIRFC